MRSFGSSTRLVLKTFLTMAGFHFAAAETIALAFSKLPPSAR
jgi:hypothetical protein